MTWSWATWMVSAAFVALSGLVAFLEGAWTSRGPRGVAMGFFEHGGMWGDFLLLAAVNALVVPDLAWQSPEIFIALAAGILVSVAMHRAWYHRQKDHVWPDPRSGKWWADLGWAGLLHVVYMAAEIALLVLYVFAPAPPPTVVAVSVLLTIHVVAGVWQPGWFMTGRWISRMTLAQSIVAWGAIWGVAVAKMG